MDDYKAIMRIAAVKKMLLLCAMAIIMITVVGAILVIGYFMITS